MLTSVTQDPVMIDIQHNEITEFAKDQQTSIIVDENKQTKTIKKHLNQLNNTFCNVSLY